MSRIGEAANRPPQSPPVDPDVFHGQIDATRAHQDLLRGLDGKQACPFCGSVSERSASPCARCGMDNTPEARKATKSRIGPWYVLQARNPAAPGMRFETLLSFVRKGRVRARSVVRGPTTHQLWRFAAHVKGLSREFGLCFSCGSAIEPAANVCPQCNRLQEPPINPDVLLEDGSEEQVRPVYRELPDRSTATVPEPPSAHEPEPEEADIIIPAFGGFGHEEPAPAPPVPPAPQFSEGPPVAPARASASSPSQQRNAVPPSSPMSVTMSYPPAPPSPIGASPAPRPGPGPRQAAAAAASNENPFAIAPPSRKKGGDAGAFLSAKELAAAFKLSFDPGADMDSVEIPDQVPASAMPEGMRPGAMVPRGPMGMTAPASAAPPRRKRRGAFSKFVLFVLILAGTGLAVLMWVDPAFRARAIEWTKTTWAGIRKSATGAGGAGPSPAATNAADEFDVPDPTPIVAATVPSGESPNTGAEDDVDITDDPTSGPAESAPVVGAPPTPAPAPNPATPANRAAPRKPAAAPRPASPASGDAPAQDNFARMNQLRRTALIAEGKGDFDAALKAWEEIEKLPSNVWPSYLKSKLERARERAK